MRIALATTGLIAVAAVLAIMLVSRTEPSSSEPAIEQRAQQPDSVRPTDATSQHDVHRIGTAWAPDGAIWFRVTVPEGLDLRVAHAWASATDRTVVPTESGAPKAGGYYRVACDADAIKTSLVVIASGYEPAWLHDPDPRLRHDVALRPLRQKIVLLDADTGERVRDAELRVSRSAMEEHPWRATDIAGPDGAIAIYTASPANDGAMVLQSNLPFGAYELEVRHPHYLLDPSVSRLELNRDLVEVPVCMPVVASARYIGDEILEGRISMAARMPKETRVRQQMLAMELRVRDQCQDALTMLFLRDPEEPAQQKARVTVTLKHGEQRTDVVPAHRLADFEGPTEFHVTPMGEEVVLHSVKVVGPSEWEGVEPNFGVFIVGTGATRSRRVQIGDVADLPEGRYTVGAGAEWALAALERDVFTVGPGQPAELRLRWREGVRVYKVTVEAPHQLYKISVRGQKEGRNWVGTVKVEHGLATFWSTGDHSTLEVFAQGCKSSWITFSPTADPRIFVASCRFEARQ